MKLVSPFSFVESICVRRYMCKNRMIFERIPIHLFGVAFVQTRKFVQVFVLRMVDRIFLVY